MILDHVLVRLSWPDPQLSPNRKTGRHWAATHRAKVSAHVEGKMAARAALGRNSIDLPERVPVTITFVAPDRRRRDLDNLHAAMKPALDGIAAALNVDDSRFCPVTLDRAVDKEGRGFALVEVGR